MGSAQEADFQAHSGVVVKAWKKKKGGNASGLLQDISSLPCHNVNRSEKNGAFVYLGFHLRFAFIDIALHIGISSQVTL